MSARFSNAMLQTLLVFFWKRPPKSRCLLIIGTTSERSVLRQIDVINTFDVEIPVSTAPNLTDLNEILESVNAFDQCWQSNQIELKIAECGAV
jgi:vesicle-fusing ATPase